MFSTSFHPKRTGLQVLIVSVLISAALAVSSLLIGEFGETDGQILLTALAVAAASVLTLANGIALEKGRSHLVGPLAIMVSILGFAVSIVAIWDDFSSNDIMRTGASAIILGVALTHWSLVSMAQTLARYRWLKTVAYPLSGLLAAFLIGAIWERVGNAATPQTVGVVAILTVAVSIILPVLQRLSPLERPKRRQINYCPYCGKRLNAGAGAIRCPSCEAAFRIRSA
ncbi:MAG TPA: hypothetical protein QGI07_00295 [Dehalococcoidia bacterium]|jgi:hypothetical protein|nr:hypothetical protein [Chloroflexota bacterium]MDP5876334.1 hypothetical protein [Dehalococcoidia bacterium]MDP6272893.1 hypothetical protein [Dehalococcoidia bacterium]MDP7161820.1 hypothetical protein [Dehalococcoidia bacterium]MDP7212566.1 hypothetical protein [Dehalococcoidia bacterium]|tara:strand:- start:292 stop:972 length:681 start_codon:yes stop_codon:yes gene_type:complete